MNYIFYLCKDDERIAEYIEKGHTPLEAITNLDIRLRSEKGQYVSMVSEDATGVWHINVKDLDSRSVGFSMYEVWIE